MARTKTPNLELVLATWPDRGRLPAEKLNCETRWANGDESDSFWLELRMKCVTDPDAYIDNQARAVQNIGLWCWVYAIADDRTTHSIEPRLHDVYAATLVEAERLVKFLRGLVRKLPQPRDDFRLHMQDVVAALGIRKAVQYHGINTPDTFVPVYDVLPLVFDEYDRRLARCVANRAIRYPKSA